MNRRASGQHFASFPERNETSLGRNRLRERLDDVRNDVAVHEFLQDSPLILEGIDIGLERLLAPVLPHREVDADRRFRKLPGADLIGIRARLDIQSALQTTILLQRQHYGGLEI